MLAHDSCASVASSADKYAAVFKPKLAPKLVKRDSNAVKLIPSVYAQVMSQTTEERLTNTGEMHPPRILELMNMGENTNHKVSSLDVDQSIFQPFPSEVVFQNYSPFKVYRVPLELRNSDKAPRKLKVVEEESLYFKLVCPPDAGKKVAPGMASVYTIVFSPQENKDYVHRLVCVTEREKFEVPIRAIGARAILDFPDSVNFPVSAVNCLSEKTLLVRNIGNCEAKFHLRTCRPFSVQPSVGTLDVGQSLQVTVEFLPKTIGDHKQVLLLHYHSGEDVEIILFGESVNINVGFENSVVVIEETYISLISCQKVVIKNQSDSIVHYQWRNFASEEEDEEPTSLQDEKEDGLEPFLLDGPDLSLGACMSRLALNLQEPLAESESQHRPSVEDQPIILRPLKGEIWPNSVAEVDIIFRPQEDKFYQQMRYCQITGLESRLPLCIQGEGLGPKLQFSFNFLDMGNIVIGAKQSYKLVLRNKGLITGTFRLMEPSTALGQCFCFEPSEGEISPGDSHNLVVHFLSETLGAFTEELHFRVEGNPRPVVFTFRGCLTGPTFHFSVPEINFGEVSYGFPQTLTCCLSNTSVVPVTFALRIPGDGTGQKSITSEEQVTHLSEWHLSDRREARPREFSVSPCSVTVRPMADIDIQLTFCSNTLQDYNLALVLDVQGVGEDLLALPIKASCIVPDIILGSPEVHFPHFFVHYPYEHTMELVNDSNFPACYGLQPQRCEDDPLLEYSSPRPRGVVHPRSSALIPLVLLSRALGALQQSAYIAILGCRDPPLEFLMSCVGYGPSVSVASTKLNFGIIPVLTDVTKTLQLSNNSPVPARFFAQMVKSKSPWKVEPGEGEILPEESLDLRLIAYLSDTLPFQDELCVKIQASQTYNIPVCAKGKGTTIVTDRPFAPSLDLGTHFSSGPCRYPFRITNMGRRIHQLLWTNDEFLSKDQLSNRPMPQKGKASQTCSQEAPVFSLSPRRLSLSPGESADMLLEGSSSIPKEVTEKLLCYAVVGRQYGKDCIMTADITCRFVSPAIDISSHQLSFYVEKAPGESLLPLYQKLILTSRSTLNLPLELTLHPPFGLCNYEGDEMCRISKSLTLEVGAQKELWVCFSPSGQDRRSQVVEDALELCYHGHPRRENVALRGEVQFPNLHFSSTTIDFGCILNNTKSRRKLTITNCSPLCVSYRWAFLVDQQKCHIGFLDEESQGTEGETETRRELLEQNRSDPNRPEGEFPDSSDRSPTGRRFSRGAGRPSLSVKEVFDISSLHGELLPGDSKLLTFSFLGHANITTSVLALCEVEGGPQYQITLKGQASSVSYQLDKNQLDFGFLLHDHVAEEELTLKNTGKVGFDFTTSTEHGHTHTEEPIPGQLFIVPAQGHLEPNSEMKISVSYLPGVPEVFYKTFQLQVAFYESESITVRGEGFFPHLCVDLPRYPNEASMTLLKEAQDSVETENLSDEVQIKSSKEAMFFEEGLIPNYDVLVQMELDRLLVKENCLALQSQLANTDQRGTPGSNNDWIKKLSKIALPEYTLDFGSIINGSVVTSLVKVTNSCPVAVSFRADRNSLAKTAFSTEMDRVLNLPSCESEIFEVKFDTKNLDLGKMEALLPIQVLKGPVVNVRIIAEVVMPSLAVTPDLLQFDTIQCGLCQVANVHLFNHCSVKCDWIITQEDRHKAIDKHLPPYLRRLKPKPAIIFEVFPSDGTLYPGERMSLQVRFSPAEGHQYSQRMVISLSRSAQKILLLAQGQGEEPQLEFSSSELDLGAVLPFNQSREGDVIVRNPCHFPIEFYSVDCDKQFLEEEEILRTLKGYDARNVLLLPPRAPGETLPQELLEYQKEKHTQELYAGSDAGLSLGDLSSITSVGDIEYDPVSAAVARYLGIDPAQDAKHYKGIAVIVHGAPLSGKTSAAVTLAKHYGAAWLTIDEVVHAAVSSGTSPAAARAREILTKADEEKEEPGNPTAESEHDAGVLSIEAVAKHTAEIQKASLPKVPPSTASTRKKTNVTGSSQKNDTPASVTPSLTDVESPGGLPEDLLVRILWERLQLSDCRRGIVFDGLESSYCRSLKAALQAILKALGNSRLAHVLNLFNSYAVYKRREQERLKLEEERRQQELENLSEESTPRSEPNSGPEMSPSPAAEQLTQLKAEEKARQLQQRFLQYDQSQPEIKHILQFWDRRHGLLLQPMIAEIQEPIEPPPSAGKKSKKERKKEEALKLEAEASISSENTVLADLDPVPHVWLSILRQMSGAEMASSMKLTPIEQVLEEVGLISKDPPILPPVTFAMVTYPKPRSSTLASSCCFTMMVPLAEDEKDKIRVADTATPSGKKKTKPVIEEPKPEQMLSLFRWVVPPQASVTLRFQFKSDDLGLFDQCFCFEVMGNKRVYKLHCRGVCDYPSICRDLEIVFSLCKSPSKDVCDFGALLCGRSKERYRDEHYPENMRTFVIQSLQMETEIDFCFRDDLRDSTFLLDPPKMSLAPNEKKLLRVWAFPNSPRHMKDSVVCCVKGNPEPVIFPICCSGFRPELELDSKVVQFDKIPLHRKEMRRLCMTNKTIRPVAWRLKGLDLLGEEFSVSQDHGVINPGALTYLLVYLFAKNPLKLKKSIGLEVTDEKNTHSSVQHSESIHIIAEVYDIAVDIFLPEDSEGLLDFGVIRVSEEVKRSIKLENKGKYDIAFKLTMEGTETGVPDLNSAFIITPHKGVLHPANKPTSVQIVFHPTKEVFFKDKSILNCQVIEPNMEDEVTISSIPIKVSAQAIFAKYAISPSCSVNFGPLTINSSKSLTFTIVNRGDLEVRFNIKTKKVSTLSPKKGSGNKKVAKEVLADFRNVANENSLIIGIFLVTPIRGALAPGHDQVVTVECSAESAGKWVEYLAIDIPDRDPSDCPGGIPYQLLADVCFPGIAGSDFLSIFEEHFICKNSDALRYEQHRDCVGVYLQEENKFVFNNVLVGQSAKAQLRLTNPGRVPCELNLQIKSGKGSTSSQDIFALNQTKLCIASHSHAFISVSFSPLAMQTYHAMFEATLKINPSKTKALEFDLVGDGDLPCFAVIKPVRRTDQGQPLLQFKRVIVGRVHTLPLVIRNNGNVPAQIRLVLQTHTDVFTLKAAPETVCRLFSPEENPPDTEEAAAQIVSLTLTAGQQAGFHVEFHPKVVQKFEASVKLMLKDNQYDQTSLQLLGEAYNDIVVLDNIGSKNQPDATESPSDCLDFGECHVGQMYQETFTMTNPDDAKMLRFEWLAGDPQLSVSPQVGHLHAACSKVVTVTFCAKQPVVWSAQKMSCKLSVIQFKEAADQVPDWDDCQRTVKWVGGEDKSQSKRKEVVTDPEPHHSIVENTSKQMDLLVSVVCDYVQYQCDTAPVRFKDTMLYQSRVFRLPMENNGKVAMEYSWQIRMETLGKAAILERESKTPSSTQSRTPVRPASSLPGLSSLLLGDPELPPFSVEPYNGTIRAGASQTFKLRFSPLEVAEFKGSLICSISNLKEDKSPVISLSGRSLLPYCHFHLEDSDYLTGNRRSTELYNLSPVDPRSRVIEFTTLGIGTAVQREFSIINPTNKPYSFMWRCEDRGSSFRCLTPDSSIQPGKEVKISFEFKALNLDLLESFWTFIIPEHNLSLPFLLVGTANEPVVYIDRPNLNMGNLLIDVKTHFTVFVVNEEDRAFHFTVKDASCNSLCSQDRLALESMEGSVPPKNKSPLVLWITPAHEGEVTFNLVLTVGKKLQPLTLRVRGQCYRVDALVKCESPEGSVTTLSPNQMNLLDFKQVELKHKATLTFMVSNLGKFSIDVDYELCGPAALQHHLQVDPASDTVSVGGHGKCHVTFCPQRKCVLHDLTFCLKIRDGPTFHCSLMGSAVAPQLEFSFYKYDFGKQFIHFDGMEPARRTLLVRNGSDKEVSLGCLFSNTNYLEVSFPHQILCPGGSLEVLFTFYPRKVAFYNESVVFMLNNSTKQAVEIQGQGVEMKIYLENPAHKAIHFGALQIGQQCQKLVPLVNDSHMALTFSIQVQSGSFLWKSKSFSVSPSKQVTLKGGGGRCVLELTFRPQQRISAFIEKLQLSCLGVTRPLLVIRGSCQGVEVVLDTDNIQFGAVAKKCRTTREIIMQNTGDMGTRFIWDLKKFVPDFWICPAKGYISPGMELTIEVTFCPTKPNPDVRYDDLYCSIEGGKPLKLILTGSCVKPQVAREVVNFACAVRGRSSQTLTLELPPSPTAAPHSSLKCLIGGDHWSGPPSILIPASPPLTYEIIYRPLVMTPDGVKHEGSVFFSFPDGSGILYNLHGTATSPAAESTITEEIPCKSQHTQMIPVCNWLPKPQRFHVEFVPTRPERWDASISLKGQEYIDVPPLKTRLYRLSFFTYREGHFHANVMFRNKATGEYLFHVVNYKASAPKVTETIELHSRVRQTSVGCVEVKNPLPQNVTFKVECQNSDISAPPTFPLAAQCQGKLTFEYRPLCEGEASARLVLNNTDLGQFFYDLQLKATPAPLEKPLYFRAALGSKDTVIAKFSNYSRVKAEYSCKVDNPNFSVEKTISTVEGSHAGTDASVQVHFEPFQVGEIQGLLSLCSQSGGEYVFPLFGTGSPPKPQGPIAIPPGASTPIPFKNVFPQTTTFTFQVDNPVFTVKASENITAQNTQQIQVSFKEPKTSSKGPFLGKLTVSCPRLDSHGHGIFWVYYLRSGHPEPSSEKKKSSQSGS